MKRLTTVAACLCLTACATAPAVETRTIPVPVPCEVSLPEPPVFPFDAMESVEQMEARGLSRGEILWEQATTLLADRRVRMDYERQLRAAAGACS